MIRSNDHEMKVKKKKEKKKGVIVLAVFIKNDLSRDSDISALTNAQRETKKLSSQNPGKTKCLCSTSELLRH